MNRYRFISRPLQVLWFLVLISTTVLLVAAIPARYAQLSQAVPQLDVLSGTLGLAEAAVLAQMGFSVSFYAAYVTFFEALTAFGGILVGALIFWRQRHDGMALFVSIALITLGTFPTPLMTSLLAYQPALYPLITLLQFIAIGPSFLIFYVFPDGRFVPRWTMVAGAIWLAYSALWLFFPAFKPPISVFAVQTASTGSVFTAVALFILVFLLIGVYSQIYRYRQVSTPVQRQQTKWIVFGFSTVLLLLVTFGAASLFIPFAPPSRASMLYLLIAIPVILLGLLIPPITVMFSILKFRLWDIDILIRRTVTYSLLTALLVVIYFGSVILLQRAFSLFLGAGQDAIVTVISTLAIAALFVPLRNWIQHVLDRRFYRRKYDAQQILQKFGESVRDETDLEHLTGRLVEVVNETMQPKSVTVWLKQDNARTPRV